MAGYRPPYTLDEDNTILKMIVDSNLYYWLKGQSFWHDLSAMGCLDRSWMSLKSRFEKFILPNLSKSDYDIPDIEKRKIELAIYQLSNFNQMSSDSSDSGESESGDTTEEDAEKVDKNHGADQEEPNNNKEQNPQVKNTSNCSENSPIISPVNTVIPNINEESSNNTNVSISTICTDLDITCIESQEVENNPTTPIEGIMTDDDSDIIQNPIVILNDNLMFI